MSKSNVSPPRVAWTVWRYGLALLSVALALVFALLAWHAGIRRVELTIFLLGIAVTAWYGGAGPAMLAVVCSSVVYDYFFREPLYNFAVPREDIPDYVLFALFGLLVGWFGAVRRGVENALRASEQKYRQLIDASPDAIFVWDADAKCVLSNASAARLRGGSENELVGLSIGDTYIPGERDLIRERFDRAKKQGVVRFERQFLRKDNEVVPVEVSLSTAGEDQYQAVLRNISDRKKAEQELRKQADLLRLGPRCHHRARSGKPDQILERGGGEDLRLDGDGSHR
jgi:PAS domain S-box-containing protein